MKIKLSGSKFRNMKLVRFLTEKGKKLRDWVKQNFEHTANGSIIIAILVSGIIMTGIVRTLLPNFMWLICSMLGFGVTVLAAELLGVIIKIAFGVKKRNRIYWFMEFMLVGVCAIIAAQAEHISSSIVFSFALACVLALFGRSIWAVVKNRKHTVLVCTSLAATGIVLILAGGFLKSEGFKHSYINKYLTMAEKVDRKNEAVKIDTESQGKYKAASLMYGTKESVDLKTKTVDLSAFAKRDFPSNFSMKKHFGYELTEVPLAGKVWYPENQEKCPVMFLIHGNHSYTTDSYLGYDYLGEYLATFGYVVVSVDENGCNGLENENDARAVLLLENIKYLFEQNEDKTSNLYHRLDKEKVGVAGHSRGGEAVSLAYLFNDYDSYPDDGTISFDYKFDIKSIIAIAPTVDQYEPAEHNVSLENVNYLLIHGANDHDVSRTMGQKQYSNVTFTGEGDYLKSMLYITGANHGQFNTNWGRYDIGYPIKRFLNTACLMDAASQQTILKTFVKTFLDVTLKGDKTNIGLLKDYQRYAESLPKTVYQQIYQTSKYQCICNFDEDSNLNTATRNGVRIEATGFKEWKEVRNGFGMDSVGENYVLQGEWEDTKDAKVSVTMPEISLKGKSLAFDLVDLSEEKGTALLDGTVTLYDAAGNVATTRISNHTIVYPALPVQLRKLDYVFGDYEYKHQFQTVTLPVDAFQIQGSAVNMERIVKITIAFDGNDKGCIGLDNVGVEGA